jgi:hypothetical protein
MSTGCRPIAARRGGRAAESWRAASYVFARSHLRMMEMLLADRKRAFYGQAQPVHLHPLDPIDLGAYISDRFEATGKALSAEALGGLLDLVKPDAATMRQRREVARAASSSDTRGGQMRRLITWTRHLLL